MADQPNQPSPAPDAYQAEHMAQGALYYDKIRAPLAYHLLLLLPLVMGLGSGIAAASLSTPAAMVPSIVSTVVLSFVWLLFSVLRISVTRDEVFVQYGLFGPRIPVRDIRHCAAVSYDWKRYGGWGIRYGRDGSVAYNMLGDHGRAVEIVYEKGGKEHKLLLASRDPERLAAAVERARAEAAALRIAEPAEVVEPVDPVERVEPAKDEITRQAEAEAEAIAAEAQAEAAASAEKQG